MSDCFAIETTCDKGGEGLESIKEVPEIEKGNDGESDVSQSTLAVSEDSTINTEDFTIYEDTNITVQESEFIEIEEALRSVGEIFNDVENSISEIEDDIKQCELEIQAMELEMFEIEKAYILNDESNCSEDEMSEKLVSVKDNQIVRYFKANFISWPLIKYERLISAVSLLHNKTK